MENQNGQVPEVEILDANGNPMEVDAEALKAIEAQEQGGELPVAKKEEQRHDVAGEELNPEDYEVKEDQDVEESEADKDVSEETDRLQEREDELLQREILLEAGGEESYQALAEFALENLSKAELDAYDNIMETGTKEQCLFAVRMLKRLASVDSGELLSGEPAQTLRGFASEREFMEALNNPRYGVDPEYTREVETRTALSMGRI